MRRLAWTLTLALLLCFSQAQAGTPNDPEITDDAGDPSGAQVGGVGSADGIDILQSWISGEDNSSIYMMLQVEAAPSSDTSQTFRYDFGFTYDQEAIVQSTNDAGQTGGFISSATWNGAFLNISLDKAAFASPLLPGTNLTGLSVTATATSAVFDDYTDRAPDSGMGRDYIIGSQAMAGMDYDQDGIDDRDEIAQGTNPAAADSDGDGLDDPDELAIGSNPNNPDTDGDNLTDGEEIMMGTSPLLADTDGDGVSDFDEAALGTDPTMRDTDGDGLADGAEALYGTNATMADTDQDGRTDGQEVVDGTDPTVADADPNAPAEEGLADWIMWAALALGVILIAVLILLLLKFRGKESVEVDEEVLEDGQPRPDYMLDEDYLQEGLSPEEMAEAKARFDARQNRFYGFGGDTDPLVKKDWEKGRRHEDKHETVDPKRLWGEEKVEFKDGKMRWGFSKAPKAQNDKPVEAEDDA